MWNLGLLTSRSVHNVFLTPFRLWDAARSDDTILSFLDISRLCSARFATLVWFTDLRSFVFRRVFPYGDEDVGYEDDVSGNDGSDGGVGCVA